MSATSSSASRPLEAARRLGPLDVLVLSAACGLVAGELATPDTWEVALSGGSDKREAWERLLEENIRVRKEKDLAQRTLERMRARQDAILRALPIIVQSRVKELHPSLEEAALALGYPRVRLDTGPKQVTAQRLYRSAGYAEIAPYNDNPFACFWGEKHLA